MPPEVLFADQHSRIVQVGDLTISYSDWGETDDISYGLWRDSWGVDETGFIWGGVHLGFGVIPGTYRQRMHDDPLAVVMEHLL